MIFSMFFLIQAVRQIGFWIQRNMCVRVIDVIHLNQATISYTRSPTQMSVHTMVQVIFYKGDGAG